MGLPCEKENQVGRGAESRQAQVLPVLDPGEAQRPVADCAGAQERRRLGIGEDLRDGMGGPFGDDHVFPVAPVGVPARGPETGAEVLQTLPAEFAVPAGRKDPADADPSPSPNGRPPFPSPTRHHLVPR
jgi:hypothetical protein